MAQGICRIAIIDKGTEKVMAKDFNGTGWKFNMDITKPYYAKNASDLTKFLRYLDKKTKIFMRKVTAVASGSGSTTPYELYKVDQPYVCFVKDARGGMKLVCTKATLPVEFLKLGTDSRGDAFVPLMITMKGGVATAINGHTSH